MPRISGIITVVQEGRFRLSSDDGRSILFTLSSHAPLEPQDLPWLRGGARVEVGFTTAAGVNALVAQDISLAEAT